MIWLSSLWKLFIFFPPHLVALPLECAGQRPLSELSKRCVCFHWRNFSLQPLSPPARAVFYKGSYFPFESPLPDTTSKENQSQWELLLKRGGEEGEGEEWRGEKKNLPRSPVACHDEWIVTSRRSAWQTRAFKSFKVASRDENEVSVRRGAATRRVWRRFPTSLWRGV